MADSSHDMESVGRLDEIRARADAATSGPWTRRSRDADERDGALGHEIVGPPMPQLRGQFERKADADFIAHAREDVPYLLEHIAYLEGEAAHWMDATGAADQRVAELEAEIAEPRHMNLYVGKDPDHG